MDNVSEFKEANKKYIEALKYIETNKHRLQKDNPLYKRVTNNLEEKFGKPLDAAWSALSEIEQDELYAIYLVRVIQKDEFIQKIIEEFDGKLIICHEPKNKQGLNKS